MSTRTVFHVAGQEWTVVRYVGPEVEGNSRARFEVQGPRTSDLSTIELCALGDALNAIGTASIAVQTPLSQCRVCGLPTESDRWTCMLHALREEDFEDEAGP